MCLQKLHLRERSYFEEKPEAVDRKGPIDAKEKGTCN